MWIFTETGFVSAVAHRDDNKKMMVRARDKKSLEVLSKLGKTKITTMDNADYPHRIVVSKDLFKKWVDKSIDEASYDNFKNQVAKTRGYDFVQPLHSVWSAMQRVEDVKRSYSVADEVWEDDEYYSTRRWWEEVE